MKKSVIIPFYNSYESLKELENSLIAQTQFPDEIIIIDDGSFEPLTQNHVINLKNLIIIRNKINRGPAISRNIGISNSTSEILLFTDSDCAPKEDWVEKYSLFFKDPEINIIAGEATIPIQKGLGYLVSLLGYPAGGNLGFNKMWQVYPDNTTNHLSSCNFAARKSVLIEKDLLFSTAFPFSCCEDTYLSMKCHEKNEKIYFFENNIELYRIFLPKPF